MPRITAPPPDSLFTDKEFEAIVMAMVRPDGASKKDIEDFYEWCHRVRIDYAILENVFRGRLTAKYGDERQLLFKIRDNADA